MVHSEKKVVGCGLAAAGFLIAALLVAGAAMGGDGGLADDRIADISVSESGSGGALAASPVSESINYQGRLTDSSGNPLSGTYTMTFRIYEASLGGTALATDTHSVTVMDGLFSTTINLGTSSFDGRALWLGITVQGEASEMTPRQELRPVPYALSLRPGATINSGNLTCGLRTVTFGEFNDGVSALVFGDSSSGFDAYTTGTVCKAFSAEVLGNLSSGVSVITSGFDSSGVDVYTAGNNSEGVTVSTAGSVSNGISVDTSGEYSAGVVGATSGDYSHGVVGATSGNHSYGVLAQTTGNHSPGVYAYTAGIESPAVTGWSEKDVGVYGVGKEAGGMFTTKGGGSYNEEKPGVKISTWYAYNPGVLINTSGHYSPGVVGATSGDYSEGVVGATSGEHSLGVVGATFGDYSYGVVAQTTGNHSPGVAVATYGTESPAVTGISEKDVGVYGVGKEAGGVFTTTAAGSSNGKKPAVNISTQYAYNPGVLVNTSKYDSDGVSVSTSGDYSEGVVGTTSGEHSAGVYAKTRGNFSRGVDAWTLGDKSPGVYVDTYGSESHGVEVYTRGLYSHAVYASSENGFAIYGKASNKGWGGYFENGVYVHGSIYKTGTVSFVEDHPTDPTKEIAYVCLEGGETGTYTRGSAQLIDGAAVVQLPEHFSLVTSAEGLTVQVTPTSDCKGLYVVSKSPTELVVKELNGGTSDATFDYLVNGIRHNYEEFQPIRDKQERPYGGDSGWTPEQLGDDELRLSPEDGEHQD